MHFPMFLQLWVDGGSKGGGKGEGKPSPTAFGRKGSRDFDQGSTDLSTGRLRPFFYGTKGPRGRA